MEKISKYHDLYLFLESRLDNIVRLSFEDIESIISTNLPKSAYQHRAWWANGDNSHSHASIWQDAGYKVDEVHFNDYVVFKRTE